MRTLVSALIIGVIGACTAFMAVKYKNQIMQWYGERFSNQKSNDLPASKKEVEINTMTAEELKNIIAQGESSDVTVINVLPAEYATDCSIKGTKNIPLATLEEITKTWPRDKKIVVYCAHSACNASKDACIKLTGLGFTDVRAYEGGMKEWRQKFPDETTGPCAMPYLTEK